MYDVLCLMYKNVIVMKTKQYIQPSIDVTDIQFCSTICVSPTPSPDLHFGGEGVGSDMY